MNKNDFRDDSDTLSELSEHEVKSPKKRKMAARKEESASPDGKGKTARGAAPSAWTKEEEEDLMDCLQTIIAANLAQVIKEFPRLASRKADGCIKHWNSIRRKHEAATLGAATITGNGKKIDPADRIKSDPAKSK